MKKLFWATCLTLVVASSFLAGSWYTQRGPSKNEQAGGRKILYYVDPMHPAYKSDKPGIAPDCGMELVPVYEDASRGGAGTSPSGPPGTVTINAEQQQLIGVRVETASRLPIASTLRVLGRVAAAEDLTYRVIAANAGWVQDDVAPTTGSLVKKGEKLATLYHPDFLVAQQNYVLALHQHGRLPASPRGYTTQPDLVRGVERLRSELKNLGMPDSHIAELGQGRAPSSEIMLLAPGTGIVLARNIAPGQRVERGAELYRIADLSQVWILADIYGAEEWHLKPGTVARATLADRHQTFRAKVGKTVPQFDPTTRTIKVRLEADNPGFILRPDMFVDLEVPVTRPAALIVPAEAAVDSGVKKVVYVDKGNGVFEPRKVETGWRAGDQVEIVKGLMPGEKIVVSGTFLIDSESRMRAAAAGIYGETAEDPVCGTEVDQAKAKAAGLTSEFRGQTYYFCTAEDKGKFDQEPTRYARKSDKGPATPAGKRLSAAQWEGAPAKEKESADVGHMHPPATAAGKPSSH
jgi:multidrug efflux pump subunit AcrA (membrane-fusion protein)/YHS domain-containing protein